AAAGQAAMRRSRWTEAGGLLRAAHEIEPHNIDLIRALVAVDRNLGKYDEAEKLIRAVLAVAPSMRDREVLAELSVSRKEWVRAAEQYTALLEEPGGVEDRYRLTMTLAQIYQQLGRHLHAEATPRRRPGLSHIHIAELYAKGGDRSSELAHLDLAAAEPLEPASRRYVERQRGFLYSQLGNTEQSIAAWRAAVAAGLDDSAIH